MRARRKRGGFHDLDRMKSFRLADPPGFASKCLFALLVTSLACRAPQDPEEKDAPQGELIRFQIEKILSHPLPEVTWKARDADLLTTELAEFYDAGDFQPA